MNQPVMKLKIFRLKQGSEISEVSFKSYHILIIEKLFPSMSQNTNVAHHAILRDISGYHYL